MSVSLALLTSGLAQAAALSPEKERASFRLADDALTVELVAAEPNVLSPVALTWDADGRMFVAEMIDYPTGPTAGQIRMLEDRDGDGRCETATVFADKLPFPNGVLAWNGGLLVTAAPDILFLKDTDGDGRADERRVVLTGFAEGNQQLRVNGLLWGLDGWVHGANGRSDGEIHRPGSANKFALRGHDFRFRPDTGEFEAVAGRSQFGLARDDWGNRFLSWNTMPIRHEAIPERYLNRNPHVSPGEAVQNLLPADDNGEVFPLTPAPQTFNKESTSHFNALAGLAIYRGDALPGRYRGNAFVGETLRNLVHRRVLEPDGSSFIAKRVEQRKEFLASTDPWFHPVNFTTGPDGALYIADFYREWVEHPGFVPEKLRGQVPWRMGAEHGRIWRVRARSSTFQVQGSTLNLGRAPVQELVRHLENANGWWRDTAQRLLTERLDQSAAPSVRKIALRSPMPEARVQALHTLAGLDALDDATVLATLRDRHPRVRETALRLAESRLKQSPTLLKRALALADDADARVRLQVALSLGETDPAQRVAVLVKLATRPDLDHITLQAIRSSMGDRPWPLLERIWDARPATPAPIRLEFIRAVATEVGAGRDAADRESLQTALADARHRPLAEAHLALFAGFAQGLATGDTAWRQRLRDWSAASDHARFLDDLVAFARDTAARRGTVPVSREAAFSTLARAGTPDANAALLALLLPPHPDEAQAAAAAALVGTGDPSTLRQTFAAWGRCPISVRRKLLAGCVRSPAAVAVLIEALQQGRVAVTELDASVRQSLLQTKSPELKSQVQKLFGPDMALDRSAVVETFTPALQLAGDSQRGAASFAKLCLQCHAVRDRGQRIGPDLSGIGVRPREALLSDILDPSRLVAADFVGYTVTTTDGNTLTGLLVSETAAGLTLRRAGSPDETVPRTRIKEVQASGRSLMPDGFEAGLTPQDLADLLEFLRQPDPKLLPEGN